MENVYEKVDRFYKDDLSSWTVVSQTIAEKYIRGMAWQGNTDVQLTQSWDVLKSVLLYMDHMKLPRLDNLMVSDYQRIIYENVNASQEKESFQRYVPTFISELEKFYGANPKLASSEANRALKETLKSFKANGEFSVPEIELQGEFQQSPEDIANVDGKLFEDIEEKLTTLFSNVSDYFRGPKYQDDVSRAILLFTNPGDIVDRHQERDSFFWTTFWDYFFFDYHLIANDRLPIQQYLLDKENELSASDRFLIKWCLRTSFNVYTIKYIADEYLECQELLTGDTVRIGCDYGDTLVDPFNILICGHRYMGYPMELDFMACMSATHNQQKRIKEELLRQYEAFQLQEPSATIQDFLSRHTGAVLHNIQLIISGRLLSAASYEAGESAMCVNEERLVPKHRIKVYNDTAKKLGVSKFGRTLATRLYKEAYVFLMDHAIDEYDCHELMAAAILMYRLTNGLYNDTMQVFIELQVDEDRVCNLIDILKEGINCCIYDTRYLSEEGFVNSLYKMY